MFYPFYIHFRTSTDYLCFVMLLNAVHTVPCVHNYLMHHFSHINLHCLTNTPTRFSRSRRHPQGVLS
jgi:hypothetical protein